MRWALKLGQGREENRDRQRGPPPPRGTPTVGRKHARKLADTAPNANPARPIAGNHTGLIGRLATEIVSASSLKEVSALVCNKTLGILGRMNHTPPKVSRAYRPALRHLLALFALTAGTGLSAQTPSTPAPAAAPAAGEQPVQLQQFVTLGSRFNDRTIADSVVPIDVISLDDLHRNGYTELRRGAVRPRPLPLIFRARPTPMAPIPSARRPSAVSGREKPWCSSTASATTSARSSTSTAASARATPPST